MAESPRPTPNFRADLEGLRGISILLVVAFHAGVPYLGGGFVGVDVLFVMSGYFITAILLRSEGADSGLTSFYGGRALRLLPALLLVLLATLGMTMWLYAPIDRPGIAADARAVALYAGNIEFARTSTNYFGAGENPLLHTWSLAVEEQFYIVWPLLLALPVFLMMRNGVEGADRRRTLTLVVIAAAILSLAGSLWLTQTAQPWAFFGMPTRIWEFALGGLIAIAGLGARVGSVAALLQGIGLAAIVIPAVAYSGSTLYPGVAAMAPALGSAALIASGETASESVVTRVLSHRVPRWFGRVSYAWYLWHWPLVGLGGVLDPDIGVLGRLAWSAVALVLAWLTYLYVEQPARRRDSRLARLSPEWLTLGAVGASVGVALIAQVSLGAARARAASPAQRPFAAARTDRMNHECWATTVEDARGPCEFGDRAATTTLVLLGDSHAEHWLAALDRAGRTHGWRIVAMVKGGCPVADMRETSRGRRASLYYECGRYREAMLRRIVALRPSAVLLSSWDHYVAHEGSGNDWQVTASMWEEGLRRTYQRLTQAGIRTIAMRGTPRTWFDVPSCLSRLAARLPFASRCEYARERGIPRGGAAAQNRAARGLPVAFIDMNDQICAKARCGVMREGIVEFTDDNHLTASFSRSMAPVLGARLAAALR